jgi:hypothetical protein
MRRIPRPSPAMVVALIALVMATTGTAVAAVSYAENAGKVDGKDAVFAGNPRSVVAGKLVTTNRRGASAGKFSTLYLPDFVGGKGRADTFATSVGVNDNATGTAQAVVSVPGFGTVTITCDDQAGAAGNEDPRTQVGFANSSGDIVNYARTLGTGAVDVRAVANGTTTTLTINGSNTYELNLQRFNRSLVVHGVAREDGRGTANGTCLNYGTWLAVE